MASKYSTCSILLGRRFATDFKCIATQARNRVWGLMYKKVLLPKVDTVFSHVNVNKHASYCLSQWFPISFDRLPKIHPFWIIYKMIYLYHDRLL